ncbi:MAG TPA: hypothetical protein VJ743_03005 [Albitalea sp.]|nr:hypothetical protein [Albitalea sp.]
MSVIAEIGATLDTIGSAQQACVFAFLMSYPLALGRLLGSRGRRRAAAIAAASSIAFVACTDPWVHAVLLVVLAIGALGVFIAAAWLVDRLSRWVASPGLLPAPAAAPAAGATPAASSPARERGAVPATVPLKG